MTRTSSRSGTRPTISRIARRTIGPIVSSSLSVGSTRLTVRPCFSLSCVSRRRSANSWWWKFDSPNQRSTRAGTAREFLRGAVGGGERLGAGRQLLERLAPDRLARLHDDDGRLRAGGDRLGHRAEQVGRAVDRGRRGGAHDDDVRVVRLAQDRGADVRGLAHERVDLALDVLPDERRQRALGLGADGERDPGRDDVERGESCAVALGDRARDVERQLGVRAAADGHDDALEVADAALLHDGDVARRLAQDLVDRRRERARQAGAVRRPPGDLPPQPKTMRSASSSAATSTMPSAACRPIRTIGWMRVPSGTKSRTAGAAGARAGPASRPRTGACPRAPRRCPGP